jgi:hypothetical protein
MAILLPFILFLVANLVGFFPFQGVAKEVDDVLNL